MLDRGQIILVREVAFVWKMNSGLVWEMEPAIIMIGCCFNFRQAKAIPEVVIRPMASVPIATLPGLALLVG